MASRHPKRSSIRAMLTAMAGATAMVSGHALADLVEYSFTTPSGEQRTLPHDQGYANPVGSMDFALRAGIDRKVRVSLLREDGTLLESATSNLLGADDRITAGNSEFYGTRLSLSAPSEGNYLIRSEILSSAGDVIQLRDYPLMVDVTAPTAGGTIYISSDARVVHDDGSGNRIAGPGAGPGSWTNFGSFYIEDIQTSGAALDRVDFIARDSQGTQRTIEGINISAGAASVDLEQVQSVMAHPEGMYDVTFRLVDQAGNHRDITDRIGWDQSPDHGGKPEPVAVYSPSSSGSWNNMAGYVPFSDGMEVRENPVQLVFRIPRDNYAAYTPYGLRPRSLNRGVLTDDIAGDKKLFEDSEYAYYLSGKHELVQHGENELEWWYGDNFANNGSVMANISLSTATAPAPVVVDAVHITETGHRVELDPLERLNLNNSTGRRITKVEFEVEPRPYRQRLAVGYSTKDYYIEPGQSRVTVAIDRPWGDGKDQGRLPGNVTYSYHASNSDLVSRRHAANIFYDFTDPEIISHAIDPESRQLTLHAREPSSDTGSFYNWFYLQDANLALQGADGSTVELAPIRTDRPTANDFYFTFDLKELGEGQYTNATVTVVDRNWNETSASLNTSFYRDTTPPSIAINRGEDASITSLDAIEIQLAADPIHDPVCYLQWEALPDETEPVELTDSGANTPKAEGQAVALGEQEVAYSLWLFSGDGSKVKVGEGSRPVNVESPYGSVTLRPTEDYSAVDRILHEFDLRLTQGGGPTCSLTLSATEAIEAAANRQHDQQRLTCLLDWQAIPDGLSQKTDSNQPQLLGNLSENGEHTVGWRTSVFSKGGTRVTLNHETTPLVVVDPEAPVITMTPSRHTTQVDDGRYVVPIAGSYFGDVEINTLPSDLDVRLERDAEVLEAETYGAGWSSRNILTRRLEAEGAGLWEESEHRVSARYNRVPDIETARSYRTITGPAANLYPTIALDATEVLDNEPLPVDVAIQDVFAPEAEYDPAVMGEWDVRLVNQRSLNDLEPLTDWQYAEDGDAAFTLDLGGFDNAGLRLLAEARLRSPIAGYERTEVSQRPTFLTVLRGGALDGDVEIRTLSGEAPFIAVFQLGFENRLDQAAMGDVHWEVSDDDGASWTEYPAGERRKTMFMQTFAEGVYQVRAHLTNRHSGLASYTEAVEVIAYPVPQLRIQGPDTVFVGDSWTYAVDLALPEDTAAQPEDVVIEWSEDGGQSWPHTGPTLTLTRDQEDRIGLRARARTALAPASDRDAYDMDRMGVEFRDVHPPRARVRGPLRVEPDQPYTFEVSIRAPYRGMAYAMGGEFTLPDGTVTEGVPVEGGFAVDYTPTAEDVAQERVEVHYTGWIEGYEAETTVEASHRTSVWEYVWPTFYALDRLSADVAPAEISLAIRHRSGTRRLEEPTYDWTLPEEATQVEAKGDAKRVFWLEEPGVYPVEVIVRDARGHEAVVEHEIVLGRPEPYDIELSYTASNRYERAPLDVRVRPSVRGGHPRDRIINHRYYLAGELLSEESMYGTATLADAGTHYMVYELETQMGTTARQLLPIEVAENQPPSCELEEMATSYDWRISADCQDPDGRVREYQWTVDGEPSGRTSYRLSISRNDHDTRPPVELVVRDDAGAWSEPVRLP